MIGAHEAGFIVPLLGLASFSLIDSSASLRFLVVMGMSSLTLNPGITAGSAKSPHHVTQNLRLYEWRL